MNLFFFCFIITVHSLLQYLYIITVRSATLRPYCWEAPPVPRCKPGTGVLSFNYVLPLKIIKSLEGPTRILLKYKLHCLHIIQTTKLRNIPLRYTEQYIWKSSKHVCIAAVLYEEEFQTCLYSSSVIRGRVPNMSV